MLPTRKSCSTSPKPQPNPAKRDAAKKQKQAHSLIFVPTCVSSYDPKPLASETLPTQSSLLRLQKKNNSNYHYFIPESLVAIKSSNTAVPLLPPPPCRLASSSQKPTCITRFARKTNTAAASTGKRSSESYPSNLSQSSSTCVNQRSVQWGRRRGVATL